MRTISVLNFKGGVGKSTLSTNVAHALAMEGQSVLLVDCCMQGNASTLLGEPRTPTLTDVLQQKVTLPEAIHDARANLAIVPSDTNLEKAARFIGMEGHRAYYTLRKATQQLTGFDVVIFDHSPSYSAVTESALLASAEMVIPARLEDFSMRGLLQMIQKLQESLVDHALDLTGIVPVGYDARPGNKEMHDTYIADLRELFGDRVLPAVRVDINIPKAQSFNQTIFEYNDRSRSAQDFRAIAAALSPKARVAGVPR